MLCVLLLGSATAFASSGLAVGTHDGLSLNLDATGKIQTVSTDGVALPVSGPGGFFVSEVLAAETPLPSDGPTRPGTQMVGTATATGQNEVTLTATDAALGVKLTAVLRGGPAIHVDAKLVNQRGGDRAFVLYFRVPVQANGWTWSSGLESGRTIPGSGRIYDGFDWFQSYRTTTSASPLASINDATRGMALALPPTSPSIYRLSYQPPYGLQLEWELGTAPEPTRFPNAANVEALLYRVSPGWAFRSALKRLYLQYPKLWTKRAKDGSWYLDEGDVSSISQPEDFALRFSETNSWASSYTRAHGIYAMKYTEPWNDHLETDPSGLQSWAQDAAANQGWPQIGKGAPKELVGQAALLSGVIDRDGQYGGYNDPGNFTDPEGTHRYVLNPDWEIPNFLGFTATATALGRVVNRGQLVEAYELFREWGVAPASAQDVFDGLYLDSTNSSGSGWAGWHLFNFRREHFDTTRAPLAFDPRSGKVALSQALSSMESVKHLADVIHEKGGLVMANALPDPFVFTTGAYCDFGSPGEGYSGDLSVMREVRSALYTKPMSYLYNGGVTDQQFQHSLLYALFPGGAGLEQNRAVYQRWAPLMVEVATAGWEPLTFARSSDPGVLVERFGSLDKGSLHFVAHRESGGQVSSTLRLEKAALGVGSGVSVSATDKASGAGLQVQDRGEVLEIPLQLGQEQSAVVALAVTSGTAGATSGEALPSAAPGSNPQPDGGAGPDEPGPDVGTGNPPDVGTGNPEDEPGGGKAMPRVAGKLSCGGCSGAGLMPGALALLALGVLARRRR